MQYGLLKGLEEKENSLIRLFWHIDYGMQNQSNLWI